MNGWEEDALRAVTDTEIEMGILASLAHRDKDASSCPSEVARTLAPSPGQGWRALMPRIRDVTARLVREDRVVVTRGARVLSSDSFDGGPIRIRRGPRFDDGRKV